VGAIPARGRWELGRIKLGAIPVKQDVKGIWMGWSKHSEFRRGTKRWRLGVDGRGGEERGKTGRGEGFGIGFIAARRIKEGRERRTSHRIGLKTAGGAGDSLGCVAVAQLQWPDVARDEEDSKVSMGGGERGGATRGAGRRGVGARGRPAPEVTRARQRNRGARGLEEEDRGPSCKK
jgi:hypothetical protein